MPVLCLVQSSCKATINTTRVRLPSRLVPAMARDMPWNTLSQATRTPSSRFLTTSHTRCRVLCTHHPSTKTRATQCPLPRIRLPLLPSPSPHKACRQHLIEAVLPPPSTPPSPLLISMPLMGRRMDGRRAAGLGLCRRATLQTKIYSTARDHRCSEWEGCRSVHLPPHSSMEQVSSKRGRQAATSLALATSRRVGLRSQLSSRPRHVHLLDHKGLRFSRPTIPNPFCILLLSASSTLC
jgi:hypothetical protein